MISFYDLYEVLSGKVRYFLHRDICNVVELVKHLPEFSSYAKEPCDIEDCQLNNIAVRLNRLLLQRGNIGLVFEQAEEVLGFAIYSIDKDFLECPLITGSNEAVRAILQKLLAENKGHLLFRVPLRKNTVPILNVLREMGFRSKMEGDVVTAVMGNNINEPESNWSDYSTAVSPL